MLLRYARMICSFAEEEFTYSTCSLGKDSRTCWPISVRLKLKKLRGPQKFGGLDSLVNVNCLSFIS